jgi:hypothetical protein
MSAGVGGAQFTHQVDDAVQFGRLEGQDPFVVAERERRHRVGADVLVLAGGHAVLGEHAAAFLVGQQVPLVGPHERIDADVGAGLLAGQKRRDMTLVELGRPMQRHTAPHRRTGPSQRGGAPEIGVSRLQRLDALGVRPDHEIGIGPQPRDVVEAAHHDAAFFLLLEKRGCVIDYGVALLAELAGPHRKHREHQVAKRRVQGVIVEFGHETYRATSASEASMALITRSTARPAAPIHAGTPIPSR